VKGKCPKCETELDPVETEHIPARAAGEEFAALAHYCPYCDCALSVQLDPIALRDSLVEEILRKLAHS